ncbi:hypothetical protein CDAR_311471 [Caerostris darwini]|uniref:Uncharacterized protein n=1 Tax=Caerostris darwini TaxID=1538125 RepID=A0AAV4UUH4_9ARAC|nr:hypothetical protein CDAR_311471 [Caerostris darwini]
MDTSKKVCGAPSGRQVAEEDEEPALSSLVKSGPESLSSKEKSNDVPFLFPSTVTGKGFSNVDLNDGSFHTHVEGMVDSFLGWVNTHKVTSPNTFIQVKK